MLRAELFRRSCNPLLHILSYCDSARLILPSRSKDLSYLTHDLRKWKITRMCPFRQHYHETIPLLKNVTSKLCQGSGPIRTQILSSKPKREISKLTNRHYTRRTYGQSSEQLLPKRWPLSNIDRTKNNLCIH